MTEKLRSLHYLNDETFARGWALGRAQGRGYGPKRIEQELKSKGIAQSLIRDVLRETFEEFGLTLPPERLIFSRQFNWTHKPDHRVWFFGGHLTRAEITAIRFGSEGQHWKMMDIAEFMAHPLAVPDLKRRLQIWLNET